ncbi:DNA ligase [Vibrio sp. V27_P1S3P104]|uniref:zinc ribbon domain-containing protein n=1 Tax=unclassified Vibrio TaxID=2614977 RepID=UPI00137255E7|nr:MULTISPECIES: zinc ribbon domain-containing protein [unclassified Vibrio]NAW70661.1 DNA ligase [Vibrio sp. V28_P6S34P95]NAX05070.1 DNA ligase [Vibrio sp. V30_P3S12P165]NAX34807.1 DNA ligase [Vibrio sp. V29_P1S30P107]NAX36881.1 DNA ligase [Vibrio sp. V27_P1S3P104]NNN44341.1 DNA ligase [Vibrio sp. 1-1(7)]
MNELCPQCADTLKWDGQYHCVSCQVHYKKIAHCPDCDQELAKLQACGAANYFCNRCNELKSKSRVRAEFQKID